MAMDAKSHTKEFPTTGIFFNKCMFILPRDDPAVITE